MPLMLTAVSVQAQNQKEMKGSNIKAQELVLTQEWDKTFPQSESPYSDVYQPLWNYIGGRSL